MMRIRWIRLPPFGGLARSRAPGATPRDRIWALARVGDVAKSQRVAKLEPVPVELKPSAPRKSGRIARLIAWVKSLFIVRVILYYSSAQGPLIASGLAYQAIFAVFAAVWVGFSVVGLVVAGNHDLQRPLIDVLSNAVPGLIKSGPNASGAIDPKVLLNAGAFTTSRHHCPGRSSRDCSGLALVRSHRHPHHVRPAPGDDQLHPAAAARPGRGHRTGDRAHRLGSPVGRGLRRDDRAAAADRSLVRTRSWARSSAVS